jgi:hypothetical protein
VIEVDPAECEDYVGSESEGLARKLARASGYYTPGLLRMLLGLTHWQWWMVEQLGELLPEPDASVGRWQRWSIGFAEVIVSEVRPRLLAATGAEPPVGRHKAAERLAWRTGLEVTPGDVEELVVRGGLQAFGMWHRHPVYDVRVLDQLDRGVVEAVVAGRPRREREQTLLRRDQCEREMGLRRADFDHLVRRGMILPVRHEEVWLLRAGRYVQVPLYRASDVDDLLAGPVDWAAVRARGAVPGARSLLAGDDPVPLREDAARVRALERLRERHAEEYARLVEEEMRPGDPDSRFP